MVPQKELENNSTCGKIDSMKPILSKTKNRGNILIPPMRIVGRIWQTVKKTLLNRAEQKLPALHFISDNLNEPTHGTHAGFTLIELVTVIVILGILAAVALPKFISMSNNARTTTLISMQGAIVSTAAMVYAKAAVNGVPMDNQPHAVDIGGGVMVEVLNGYPDCSQQGLPAALTFSSQYSYYAPGEWSSTCTFYVPGGANTSNCGVVYNQPTGTTWTPVSSGC